MTAEIDYFSAQELANRCAEEASRKEAKKRDDRFCYELVRRAFGLEDSEALNRVFNIYIKIWSQFWIRNPSQFDGQAYTAEDFLSIAFSKVYFEIKGNRFSSFPLLNPFLAYLHTTLRRVVAEYLRKQRGRNELDASKADEDLPDPLENFASSENTSDDVEKQLKKQAILERVQVLLSDTKDQTLFTCWSNGMSRAEIVATYPDWWPDENKVRIAVQRIIHRRLGSDPGLRDLLDDLR